MSFDTGRDQAISADTMYLLRLGALMSRLRLFGLVACLVSAILPLHSQTATPPDTPAGRVLRAWLDAFNTGDSTRMEEFYRRYQPDVTAANTLPFRRQTQGFDLLTIERSDPRHVE